MLTKQGNDPHNSLGQTLFEMALNTVLVAETKSNPGTDDAIVDTRLRGIIFAISQGSSYINGNIYPIELLYSFIKQNKAIRFPF